MSEPYVTLQEAASLLDVSHATLRNWDKNGKLKAMRHPVNNYRMYRLPDVLALQQQSSLFPVASLTGGAAKTMSANRPLSSADVRHVVRTLHRILRDNEGNSSLMERFDELTKLLYCKVHDERGANGGATPFVVSDETDEAVARRLQASFAAHVRRAGHLFPPRFSELRLEDRTIRQVVETLAPVRLSDSLEDLKGLAFEEVVRNTFEKGDNQQFFTPRSIVEFMVRMLGPHLSGVICDPACGTGGFLLFASDYLRSRRDGRPPELLGFEIDERLAWVAGVNLDMHDAKSFRIERLAGAASLGSEIRPYYEEVDAILTNPPFGSDLSDQEALAQLVLGQGKPSRRRGVLFIERCLDLLKPGGVVGIVIDEGVLNAPSTADVRRLMLHRADVTAVVSLPETTFMPYASVKASIVFMQKKGGNQPRLGQAETFFASASFVGKKPNGDPLLRTNAETGRQELNTDLPTILGLWDERNLSESNELGFWSFIPHADDDAFSRDGLRIDLAYHHPSRHEAVRALRASRYPLTPVAELCHLRNEAVVPSKDLQDEEIQYIGLANMEPRSGVSSPVTASGLSLKSAVKRFEAGDILYSKMRPELRKVSLVSEEMGEGFASSECLVLVPKTDPATMEPLILPGLLALLLRSDLVYGQIVHLVIGIGRPRLSKSAVMNVRIPVPPIDEQRRLMDLHLRSELAARALIAESNQAMRRSQGIMADAQKRLVDDLLTETTANA